MFCNTKHEKRDPFFGPNGDLSDITIIPNFPSFCNWVSLQITRGAFVHYVHFLHVIFTTFTINL